MNNEAWTKFSLTGKGNCPYCGKSGGSFWMFKHFLCAFRQSSENLDRVFGVKSGTRPNENPKTPSPTIELDADQQEKFKLFNEEIEKINKFIHQFISGTENFDILDKTFFAEINPSIISETDKNPNQISALKARQFLHQRGFDYSVKQFLEDGILSKAEENRLKEYQEHFSLPDSLLNNGGSLDKIKKASVLRELLDGNIPQLTGDFPVNLQKGEKVVWTFPNSSYWEDKTTKKYVGGSDALSLRIMKGVYYRTSAFTGKTIENIERNHIDTGWLILTDLNLYYAGANKGFRIPYKKIVTFQPFSYGIGIIKDGANTKPQIFTTDDGWFAYNLIKNLAQITG